MPPSQIGASESPAPIDPNLTNRMPAQTLPPAASGVNKIWVKILPIIDITTLLIMVLLLGFVDTPLAINDPDLRGFLYIMLVSLAVFILILLLDRRWFKKYRASQVTPTDFYALSSVIIRNIWFIGLVIPFVQLVSMAIGFFGAIPFVIVHIVLSRKKLREITLVG